MSPGVGCLAGCRAPLLNQPEQAIVGQMYIDWIPENPDTPNRSWKIRFIIRTLGRSPAQGSPMADHVFTNGENWTDDFFITGLPAPPASRIILADSNVSRSDSGGQMNVNTTVYVAEASRSCFRQVLWDHGRHA